MVVHTKVVFGISTGKTEVESIRSQERDFVRPLLSRSQFFMVNIGYTPMPMIGYKPSFGILHGRMNPSADLTMSVGPSARFVLVRRGRDTQILGNYNAMLQATD